MEVKARRYLISKARLAWRYYSEARKECLKESKCAICLRNTSQKDRRADHISPVIDPKVGFIDWNTYFRRLFCDKSGLQLLHSKCHDRKSAKENNLRRKNA